MKEPNLTITVTGKSGSGKSRMIYIIKHLLDAWDFPIVFDGGMDFANEVEFDKYMSTDLDKTLDRIKQKGSVKLIEKTARRNFRL